MLQPLSNSAWLFWTTTNFSTFWIFSARRRIIISNKVTLLKYCYQHFPNEEDYIFHFLYHKSLNFSKIIFQHFFNKTTGHFCWFPNNPWDKNLFQSGNVHIRPLFPSLPLSQRLFIIECGSGVHVSACKLFVTGCFSHLFNPKTPKRLIPS